MKNLLTILLASFILISGMHLSIDRHFCGGELARVTLSFSEKAASCGMESMDMSCSKSEGIASDCCRNEITRLTVDDYFGSSSPQVKEVSQPVFELFFLPVLQSFYLNGFDTQTYADTSPPGNLKVNAVSLPKICVFRI